MAGAEQQIAKAIEHTEGELEGLAHLGHEILRAAQTIGLWRGIALSVFVLSFVYFWRGGTIGKRRR